MNDTNAQRNQNPDQGTVSQHDLRRLIEKVGGPEKAAAIMGVTKGTIRNMLGARREHGFVSPAALLDLQRAAGELLPVPEPAPGKDAGRGVFMSVEALAAVQQVKVSERADGFQREHSEKAVAEIEALLRTGFTTFPPIVLGRLPDGTHVEIDGQHRRLAHLRAGIGCNAHVYDVRDLEQARQMYLVWNRKTRKPTPEETYRASRNAVAEDMKVREELFKLTFEQVHALMLGLVTHLDFVDPEAHLSHDMLARADRILAALTEDARWSRPDAATFNAPGFLRALGHFARGYAPDLLPEALEVVQAADRNLLYKDGRWTRALKEHGFRKLSDDLSLYVTPRLLGGVTEAKGGRRGRA